MSVNDLTKFQSTLWEERNSIIKSEFYIRDLLANFNIKQDNYNFVVDGYGDLSLVISLSKKYLIQIDKYNKCYNLLEENTVSNQKKKPKYHLIKKFYGEEIIIDVLRYIKNKEIYKWVKK